jgi:competence protein ComEA
VNQKAVDSAARERVRREAEVKARAQARDEARAEAWSQTRARIRIAVAITVLGALGVGILIGAYGFRPREGSNEQEILPPDSWLTSGRPEGADAAPTPWPVRVYVSGAVAESQVVELPPGSMILDALDAAGGATADADLEALNLAAPLSDNQHVAVPTRCATVQETSAVDGVDSSAPININTATAEKLQALPSIGVTRAQAIVTYREAHGPFQQIDDILSVPGIGPVIFEQIAPFITVGP